MSKISILKKLQSAFQDSEDKNLEGFKAFDKGVAKLKEELRQNITVNTLDDVNAELDKFRKKIDLSPLEDAIDTLKSEFSSEIDSLIEQLNSKAEELVKMSEDSSNASTEKSKSLASEISDIKEGIDGLTKQKDKDLETLRDEIKKLQELDKEEKGNLSKSIGDISTNLTRVGGEKVSQETFKEAITNLEDLIKVMRAEFNNRIATRGGGNMNRDIVVGGNPSTLGKYTDINFKAGSNVTITYANNETTKRTDITISATGGSSSTAGTVRSINNVSTSQVMGSVAGTDYVYICSEGVKMDLPTATGNTNLYTIKNVSNSSVLVAGTIDNDIAGVIMPVKYTSVDVISNDVDWNIT